MSENNINLSGDEARLLMASMLTSVHNAPVGATMKLYVKLSHLSLVQPPSEK